MSASIKLIIVSVKRTIKRHKRESTIALRTIINGSIISNFGTATNYPDCI